ncbi:MAG: serine/threonine protein kinase [Actinomycetia bacterium]|nr:serine/threonine protein kinase [Actinomycetes bacterium]
MRPFPGGRDAPQHIAMAFCPLGHANPLTHQFCGECGARIGTTSPAPAGPRPPQPFGEPSRRSAGKWLVVAAAVAATTALAATVTYFVARDSYTVATPQWPTPGISTQARPEPPPPSPPQQSPPQSPPIPTAKPNADLGLSIPISRPACNGQGIVVLGNVTTPGQYAQGVQRLLSAHPGASYLRTDQSCPSLRQANEAGNLIYAVFKPAGQTRGQVCAAVRAAGGDAYGKWLDTSTDPAYIIPC